MGVAGRGLTTQQREETSGKERESSLREAPARCIPQPGPVSHPSVRVVHGPAEQHEAPGDSLGSRVEQVAPWPPGSGCLPIVSHRSTHWGPGEGLETISEAKKAEPQLTPRACSQGELH